MSDLGKGTDGIRERATQPVRGGDAVGAGDAARSGTGSRATTLPELSVHIQNFAETPESWQPLFDRVQAAERAGVDRLAVSDHVLYGEQLDSYADPSTGGMSGGRQPTGPDGHWLEPMTLLAMLAGSTGRIRLSTSILLAALRTPAVLAKQAATLDVLSGGRLDLGVGVGWQREEYAACGLDYRRRGELLDQTLTVCRRLWTEAVVDDTIGTGHFERVHAMPKPAQPGGVPIWVSGRVNPRVTERLVRFGTGWIPWGDHIADPRPGIDAMREAFAAAGRDPRSLQVQGTLPIVRNDGAIDVEATVEGVSQLVEAGTTDFRANIRWGTESASLTPLVAAFRTTVGRPIG